MGFGEFVEEATLKSVLIGLATGAVLVGLFLGFLWICSIIDKKSEQKK